MPLPPPHPSVSPFVMHLPCSLFGGKLCVLVYNAGTGETEWLAGATEPLKPTRGNPGHTPTLSPGAAGIPGMSWTVCSK